MPRKNTCVGWMFFSIWRDETRGKLQGRTPLLGENCKPKMQRLNGEKLLGDLLKNTEVFGANRWVICSKLVGWFAQKLLGDIAKKWKGIKRKIIGWFAPKIIGWFSQKSLGDLLIIRWVFCSKIVGWFCSKTLRSMVRNRWVISCKTHRLKERNCWVICSKRRGIRSNPQTLASYKSTKMQRYLVKRKTQRSFEDNHLAWRNLTPQFWYIMQSYTICYLRQCYQFMKAII
jgi:hypothetical protein